MTHKDDKVIISHQNRFDLGVPEMIEGDGALGAQRTHEGGKEGGGQKSKPPFLKGAKRLALNPLSRLISSDLRLCSRMNLLTAKPMADTISGGKLPIWFFFII